VRRMVPSISKPVSAFRESRGSGRGQGRYRSSSLRPPPVAPSGPGPVPGSQGSCSASARHGRVISVSASPANATW
jgi:hypothetical protein